MSPFRVLLSVCAAASLAACGQVEADPHRFERWGQAVASIPVADPAHVSTERAAPAEPARPALRVEVLDVDSFWAARDGALQAGLTEVARAAAPAVTAAVFDQGARALAAPAPTAAAATVDAGRAAGATIQLGAFSSEAAARQAWTRVADQAGGAVAGLTPVFETVERDGRSLVRLRAGPVRPEQAESLCRAAGVADRWCASTGRS